MPATQIFLDPSAGTPAVISVGGTCYSFAVPSTTPPTATSFDSSSSDCDSCLPPSPPCSCSGPASITVGGNYTLDSTSYTISFKLLATSSDFNLFGGSVDGPYVEDFSLSPDDGSVISATAQVLCFDGDPSTWKIEIYFNDGSPGHPPFGSCLDGGGLFPIIDAACDDGTLTGSGSVFVCPFEAPNLRITGVRILEECPMGQRTDARRQACVFARQHLSTTQLTSIDHGQCLPSIFTSAMAAG